MLLAHNAAFDLLAISHKGVAFDIPIIDTLLISRALDEALDGHDLDSLAQRYDLAFPPGTRHTGYAADCKSVDLGSTPGGASIILLRVNSFRE